MFLIKIYRPKKNNKFYCYRLISKWGFLENSPGEGIHFVFVYKDMVKQGFEHEKEIVIFACN